MSDFKEIRFEREGPVARLVLNRPDTLNALTFPMMREVSEALAVVEGDRSIRALLFTAAGRGFCSGQDLRNRPAMGGDFVKEVMDCYYPPIAAIRGCRVPVVTAINGVVAGAGLALATAGDIAIAARSAKFMQVFSRLGLIPDLGSTYVLPRAIGRARALKAMLTAEPIPAEQAMEWGLIAQCVDDEQLMPAASALAERLAQGPTRALAETRRMVDEGEHNDFTTQFRRELEVQQELRLTADAREGVAAFVEKRQAVFRGE